MSNSNPPTPLPEMACHVPSVVVGATCLQLLAQGWITSTGLCPRCTVTLMAGFVHAVPEPLVWSVFYSNKLMEAEQWAS
ncbi:hypothetical protein [Nonomuraea longicatena]|uniref:Uncharacterized protein n=1 Tax=Nonomuraea longicatena TaxID=83682 RepID=A0ABP4AC53_9ACTN